MNGHPKTVLVVDDEPQIVRVMQANLEGMQDGILPTDPEQVQSLYGQVLHLGRLVGDLRLLSLAEAGELKLERQETDLGELVRKAAGQFQPRAVQQNIALALKVEESRPPVSVDTDRINQVLNNLLENALRFTPEGGTVEIGVGRGNKSTREMQVWVADSGPGIPPEALPSIFDRFYRGDKSRSKATGGSGLGLAIVKQLVEAHGGKVTATSPVFPAGERPAYGTRFTFTIPIVQ